MTATVIAPFTPPQPDQLSPQPEQVLSQSSQAPSSSHLALPLFLDRVAAGFPSPAQDYVEQRLDLNSLCITHPEATYFVRSEGNSMIEAGIHDGDILVVNRALTAQHGDIVIASLYGDLTVKELCLHPTLCLLPRNADYPPIPIKDQDALEIFGVVTYVVHPTRSGLCPR